VVVADRRVLLSLSTFPSVVTGPITDQNSTREVPIPLIAYENDQMPSLDASDDDLMTEPSNMSKSQSILPAADPFNESSSSGNLNSTDDLLDLFEQSTDNRGVRSEYNVIPFIPPFTSAPDNLRVESRATYKKVRK
jgi:transglutaminase/protease-like cytokinesis protein 3